MHFHSIMAWPPATYDVISVTIVTGHHQTYLKMSARDKRIRTGTENVRCPSGADV